MNNTKKKSYFERGFKYFFGGLILLVVFFIVKSIQENRVDSQKGLMQSRKQDSVKQAKDSIYRLSILNFKNKYDAVTFNTEKNFDALTFLMQKKFIEDKNPAFLYAEISDVTKVDSAYMVDIYDTLVTLEPFIANIMVPKNKIDSIILQGKDNWGYFIVNITKLKSIQYDMITKQYRIEGNLIDYKFK